MLELEGNGAFGAEVSAVLGKDVTDVSHRTGAVVGRAVDDERSAAHTVAFIADVFIRDAFELARALQNGIVDRVLGHIAFTGL